MVTLVVFHHVRDYDTWKAVFDEHEGVRRGHGELAHRIYRGVDDPNRVIVHNDFPSEDAARALMADPSLPAAMERAGVTDEPWLGLIEQLEQKRYTDGTAGVTVAVHHRVRDYDAWKPVFDEHEGVRRSHGQIEHRLYRAWGDPLAARHPQRLPERRGSRGLRQRSESSRGDGAGRRRGRAGHRFRHTRRTQDLRVWSLATFPRRTRVGRDGRDDRCREPVAG